jgi:hypothetical protein
MKRILQTQSQICRSSQKNLFEMVRILQTQSAKSAPSQNKIFAKSVAMSKQQTSISERQK